MANPLMGNIASAAPAGNIPNMGVFKQAAQSAKRMIGLLQTVKDPRSALMKVAQQNPQLNEVMQLVGGRDPKEVFFEECKKHGIDPNAVLAELQN